ncbi:MAG: PaaI family thioesterase [Anaerolineae bacterium]|nr:PaaI family thioesterase [Anaerolineae bacterium]
MTPQPIQNFYDDKIAICYGCGRHNEHGLHVQTFWDGAVGVAHFMPRDYHTAFPGVVYGGLLASVIDCHSIGTAIAAMYDAEDRAPGTELEITCVTGNLNVTYLHPTPMGVELIINARIKSLTERKALLETEVLAGDLVTVRAEVIAVRVKSRANFLADG